MTVIRVRRGLLLKRKKSLEELVRVVQFTSAHSFFLWILSGYSDTCCPTYFVLRKWKLFFSGFSSSEWDTAVGHFTLRCPKINLDVNYNIKYVCSIRYGSDTLKSRYVFSSSSYESLARIMSLSFSHTERGESGIKTSLMTHEAVSLPKIKLGVVRISDMK